MSPTYQPSGLRDLRTHSNTGIVLDDTVRRGGGVRRKIFEADKKTNNVSLPLAFTGGGWMYGTELIGGIEAWMSCETGSAGKSNTKSRHQQQTEPVPAANVFRKAEQVM